MLPPRPNARALIGVRADLDGLGIELRRDLGDASEENTDLALRPLDLDDEQGLDVERIARAGERLAHFDRRPVHVFDRHGNAAMIADTQLPAASGERKPIIIGRAPSGDGTSFTVASVMTPSWPSDPIT